MFCCSRPRVILIIYFSGVLHRYSICCQIFTDLQLNHLKPEFLQAISTELESKEELIEEMMKESETLLSLADNAHLYVIPADLGDKVTSFKTDWKVKTILINVLWQDSC